MPATALVEARDRPSAMRVAAQHGSVAAAPPALSAPPSSPSSVPLFLTYASSFLVCRVSCRVVCRRVRLTTSTTMCAVGGGGAFVSSVGARLLRVHGVRAESGGAVRQDLPGEPRPRRIRGARRRAAGGHPRGQGQGRRRRQEEIRQDAQVVARAVCTCISNLSHHLTTHTVDWSRATGLARRVVVASNRGGTCSRRAG